MKKLNSSLRICQSFMDKQLKILPSSIYVICCLFLSTSSFADNESSNNTPAGAESIVVNTSYSGTVDGSTGSNGIMIDGWDYYTVTLPSDGTVAIDFSFSGSPFFTDLYYFGGCIGGWTTCPQSGIMDFRGHHAQGATIIIGVCGYCNGIAQRSYTLKVILEAVSQPNDSEPNNSQSQAESISINGTKTGHIGFVTCGSGIDNYDVYTFTTTQAGNFKAKLDILSTAIGATVAPYLEGTLRLYDGFGSPNPMITATGYPQADIIYNNLPVGTYFLEVHANSSGYGYSITDSLEPIYNSLALKLFLQGYYIDSNIMSPVLMNQSVNITNTVTDTISVELRNSSFPYNVVTSGKTILNTDGTAIFLFPTITGFYYIVVKHRNGIETWSANPVQFSLSSITYDFTTAASKAYGNNMIQVEPNIWAFYSGDINQEDNIDLNDFSLLELDINNFEFGYKATDINGDGSVDLQDVSLLELNSNQFIFSNHP